MEFDDDDEMDLYVGEFLNDEFWGYGTLTWKAGHVYRGQFVNGTMEGIGDMTFANNEAFGGKAALKMAIRYIGHFTEGFIEGYGILTFGPGSPAKKFEGYFVEDSMTNNGTLTMKDGRKISHQDDLEKLLF